jgi:hypothetical protein
MKFARAVFFLAGVFGVIVLTRGYLNAPPRLVGPLFYYGFLGVALSWQAAFFLIGTDPSRYRPIMLAGAMAKLSFFGTCMVLVYGGQLKLGVAVYTSFCDAAFAVLFIASFVLLATKTPVGSSPAVTAVTAG